MTGGYVKWLIFKGFLTLLQFPVIGGCVGLFQLKLSELNILSFHYSLVSALPSPHQKKKKRFELIFSVIIFLCCNLSATCISCTFL